MRDYWNLTFNSKSKRLQEEQLVAAETRAHNMLTIPYVSDIVGQSETSLDLERLIEEKKIILVNLSTQLSYEARKIIGTILISELLHVIEQRPASKRDQFCIYVDEFHNFAAYQDFSTLITDAPKFGVATTLAHHERAGQLSGHPRIMGATAAIADKVLFQITGRDAEELSREFAKEPEKETRYEDKYIISREPVWDLLRWHDNEQIRKFVIKYIRPLKERLEDIKGEQETERLMRSELIDEASLYRITDVLEGAGRFSNIDPDRQALSSAGRLIEQASGQTMRLMTLNEEATHIAHTFRSLNKLFCSIMDGTLDIRSGEFNNYLVSGITAMVGLTDLERKAIAFYLTVKTADWYVKKVPFDIAQAYGLFSPQVEANQKEVDDEWQNRKNEYMEKHHKMWWFDWKKLDHYVDPKKTPQDLTAGIGNLEIDQTMAVIWYRNRSVIQKLQEFVEICRLLSMPENRIIKRSGQSVVKQINTRTEQEMINEMARKLTELPHYTAYAKLLPSWKGKIRTLPLDELHKPYRIELYLRNELVKIRHWQLIRNNSWMFAKKRTKIEEEIKERHERLAGGHEEEPPAVGAPAWPTLVARWPEDILPRRVSRLADVSEDEPPPSRS